VGGHKCRYGHARMHAPAHAHAAPTSPFHGRLLKREGSIHDDQHNHSVAGPEAARLAGHSPISDDKFSKHCFSH
jgi:hypothetical protein